jgi:glycosyltransferase involved in cell wall biosynthesis
MRAAIISNYAPHYRLALWSTLSNDKTIEYVFIAQTYEKFGIKPISDSEFKQNKIKFKNIKNIYFKGIEIWQRGVLRIIWKKDFDHYIFLGNMYCISTWIAAISLRLNHKKVTFWEHGLNEKDFWLHRKVRILFYRLPDYHLLYNNRAKEILIREKFDPNKLFVVFNSLDYDLQRSIFASYNSNSLFKKKIEIFGNNNPSIIFIGRLTKVKKIRLLIEALNIIKNKGDNYNLLIVGDGPEISTLKMLIEDYELKNIVFWGSCYDERIIGELIGLSDLTVSPGNVGLTAVHSLSYGTPVITHNDFKNQMPEVEIIEENITGAFFKMNDSCSLAESIDIWFKKYPGSKEINERCRLLVDQYYNPHYQASIFRKAIIGSELQN